MLTLCLRDPGLRAGWNHSEGKAGVSNNPKLTISVNGKEIRFLSYANDAAAYRAAVRSARYQLEDIAFPADLLVKGANTARFGMTAVGKNGGIMYETIKLEIE